MCEIQKCLEKEKGVGEEKMEELEKQVVQLRKDAVEKEVFENLRMDMDMWRCEGIIRKDFEKEAKK